MGKIKLQFKRSVKGVCIVEKYGCTKGLILLEHSTFKGIAFIIVMWLHKFNKYAYLHLQKGSLLSRACCISDIIRQQTKSPSSDIKRFIMEIKQNKKIHKFRKSLNSSLVTTSTVSFNSLFQIMQPIYCQSKKLSKQSLFTLSFVQLLNIYFFSKSFLLPFNQCLGASYLTLGEGLVVKASCCQIILYILHFARFPILIFKFNFAISTFGNLLRNVQLK